MELHPHYVRSDNSRLNIIIIIGIHNVWMVMMVIGTPAVQCPMLHLFCVCISSTTNAYLEQSEHLNSAVPGFWLGSVAI